jgi:hypothetical protein
VQKMVDSFFWSWSSKRFLSGSVITFRYARNISCEASGHKISFYLVHREWLHQMGAYFSLQFEALH